MRTSLRLLLALVIGLATCILPIQVSAGVNDFVITDYSIKLELASDAQQRSELKTQETITAEFPNFDQNRGIERAIPKTFDSHSTSLKIDSVQNDQGQDLEYSTFTNNGNLVVRIGDPDEYVRGKQIYKLTYSQRDVTRDLDGLDEFYWDTNGTDWRVPISNLDVSLAIDPSLEKLLTGNQACYLGIEGASEVCQLSTDQNIIRASADNLLPGQNITLAVGFEPESFVPYAQSLSEKLLSYWLTSLIITTPLGILSIVYLAKRYFDLNNRRQERDLVVAEFIPPKGTSVMASAEVDGKQTKAFSAQLLDLAVRHYLKIYETSKKTWRTKADYNLELIRDPADLTSEEQTMLQLLFDKLEIGSTVKISDLRTNKAFSKGMLDLQKQLKIDIESKYAYRAKDSKTSASLTGNAKLLLVLAAVSLSPIILVAALVAFVMSYVIKPYTDTGLALSQYLAGLKYYIKVAESERIQLLQSPETAQKVSSKIDVNDKAELIKLYEKVLPYAVLFGLEKDWNQRLGQLYQDESQTPSWINTGTNAFVLSEFSNTLNSFNGTANYASPTSSSSSSSGSGGGGSSGGGGGGGGGGGW